MDVGNVVFKRVETNIKHIRVKNDQAKDINNIMSLLKNNVFCTYKTPH